MHLFESNHHYRDIIHSLLLGCKTQDFVSALSTYLMDSHVSIMLVLSDDIPNKLAYFFSAQFIENTIAA